MKGTLDQRIIYLLVAIALSVPLVARYSVPPARLKAADQAFRHIEQFEYSGKGIAFVAMDYGPGTNAENGPQAEALLEHLMRKRIPIAVFSQYILAEPFLKSAPDEVARRLTQEFNGTQTWEYGRDWINLGYRPGGAILLQSIPKSNNLLVEVFKKDARGNDLQDLPVFRDVRTLRDIKILGQFTGLMGVFDTYVQFFQSDNYRPLFIHGCTSITIPDAYIYLDSGQIQGLFEGIAGAAWYSQLLDQRYPNRAEDDSVIINTSLGVAHLVIIALILFGNVGMLASRLFSKGER